MSATDRVTALREEYAHLGEDVSGLTDQELLIRELDRARAESHRHERACISLLQDEAKRTRAVYTAALRQAQEDRIAWGGVYLKAILRESMHPINELIHRVEQLPERPGARQVDELRGAAQRASQVLRGMTDQDAQGARSDREVQLVEQLRAEIGRLRNFIGAQGQQLHTAHGPVRVEHRCECPGCELIRAMDDVPTEGGAA